MRRPSKYNAHKALLTDSMQKERAALSKLFVYGAETQCEEYIRRATLYNKECEKIGATLVMMVLK